jgi:hypothetical protein
MNDLLRDNFLPLSIFNQYKEHAKIYVWHRGFDYF